MKRLIKVGRIPTGKNNDISDVEGVTVGHCTKIYDDIRTGITAILPHQDNLFTKKLLSASYVMNGFGKSCGLMQVDELNQLETPILLTNTLAVGSVANGLVSYMIANNPEIGRTEATVNPLVLECNDGELNNIQKVVLGQAEVNEAISKACSPIAQGSVGAGSGMICHGLKGGIGSSSRIIEFAGKTYTLGVLVNSNFGHSSGRDLIINNMPFSEIINKNTSGGQEDKGSIIVIVATDIGLSPNSLKRIIKRAAIGIGRTGSYIGHGSGDVFLGFSTANPLVKATSPFRSQVILNDDYLNILFQAVIEATQEAIYNSLLSSPKVNGFRKSVDCLGQWLDQLS